MQKKIGFLLILTISTAFIFFYYGQILLSPNSFLFNPKGDGIKNYYTYAYHNVNDTSAVNFQGLNYPYGEHFLYTDCHPVFTLLIRNLKAVFPDIVNYQIGIINFFMIFSLLLTAIFVWLILVKYKVNEIYAVLPAFGITVMQPQLFRLLGHLALSYSFFIPLTWLLLLKFIETSKKIFFSVVISIYILILFFIHGYLGMIAASFLLSYYIFDFIFNKKTTYKNKIYFLYIFVQSVLPLLIFRYFIAFTDNHPGRTDNPWGFFFYRADWDTVFIANHPPLNPLWHKILNIHQTWEGWAYIGITSIIAVTVFLIRSIKKSSENHKIRLDLDFIENKNLQIIILASILTLLFSMALPFRAGLRFITDWIPLIKQFRSVGRFAWIFYCVITISSSIYLFNLGKYLYKKQKKIIALAVFLLPSFYIVEGIPYHQTTYKTLVKSANLFDYKQLDDNFKQALQHVNPNDYSAIFPLPFYYINSDYGKSGTEKIYKISMIMSYFTKLPLQGSYLGRTSIPEAKKIKQLLAPGYYPKAIRKDIKSDKPYLVIYSKENLDKYEETLLQKSKKIYENDEFTLCSLSLKKLFENTAKTEIDNFNKIKDSLISQKGFLCSDTCTYLYFDEFENMPDTFAFKGKGAFSADKIKYSVLAEIQPGSLTPGKEYTLSFWMYNQGRNFGQGVLNSSLFIEGKKKNGNLLRIAECNPTQSCVIYGNWSLIELNFKIPDTGIPYKIIIKGGKIPKTKIHTDNLLIKDAKIDVYKILKEKDGIITELFKNNNIIKTIKDK